MSKSTLAFSDTCVFVIKPHTSPPPPPPSPPLLLPTNLIPSSRFHGQFYLAPSQRVHHQFFTTFHVPFLCRSAAKLPIQVVK